MIFFLRTLSAHHYHMIFFLRTLSAHQYIVLYYEHGSVIKSYCACPYQLCDVRNTTTQKYSVYSARLIQSAAHLTRRASWNDFVTKSVPINKNIIGMYRTAQQLHSKRFTDTILLKCDNWRPRWVNIWSIALKSHTGCEWILACIHHLPGFGPANVW